MQQALHPVNTGLPYAGAVCNVPWNGDAADMRGGAGEHTGTEHMLAESAAMEAACVREASTGRVSDMIRCARRLSVLRTLRYRTRAASWSDIVSRMYACAVGGSMSLPRQAHLFAALASLLGERRPHHCVDLDWKPLYAIMAALYLHDTASTAQGAYASVTAHWNELLKLMRAARRHYPPSAAVQVVHLVTPLLHKHGSAGMFNAVTVLYHFLPKLADASILPLRDWLAVWASVTCCPLWDRLWFDIFARVTQPRRGSTRAGEEGDIFAAHVPFFMHRLQGLMDIPVDGHHLPARAFPEPAGALTGNPTSNNAAFKFITRLIMLPPVMPALDVLLHAVSSFFYPSSHSSASMIGHTRQLCIEFARRIGHERGHIRLPLYLDALHVPPTLATEGDTPAHAHMRRLHAYNSDYISVDVAKHFVDVLLPLVTMGLYASGGRASSTVRDAAMSLRALACVAPARICATVCDFATTALESVTHTHLAVNALEALTIIIPGCMYPVPHMLPRVQALAQAALPGIDANDAAKTQATVSFFTTLFRYVRVYDSADAPVSSGLLPAWHACAPGGVPMRAAAAHPGVAAAFADMRGPADAPEAAFQGALTAAGEHTSQLSEVVLQVFDRTLSWLETKEKPMKKKDARRGVSGSDAVSGYLNVAIPVMTEACAASPAIIKRLVARTRDWLHTVSCLDSVKDVANVVATMTSAAPRAALASILLPLCDGISPDLSADLLVWRLSLVTACVAVLKWDDGMSDAFARVRACIACTHSHTDARVRKRALKCARALMQTLLCIDVKDAAPGATAGVFGHPVSFRYQGAESDSSILPPAANIPFSSVSPAARAAALELANEYIPSALTRLEAATSSSLTHTDARVRETMRADLRMLIACARGFSTCLTDGATSVADDDILLSDTAGKAMIMLATGSIAFSGAGISLRVYLCDAVARIGRAIAASTALATDVTLCKAYTKLLFRVAVCRGYRYSKSSSLVSSVSSSASGEEDSATRREYNVYWRWSMSCVDGVPFRDASAVSVMRSLGAVVYNSRWDAAVTMLARYKMRAAMLVYAVPRALRHGREVQSCVTDDEQGEQEEEEEDAMEVDASATPASGDDSVGVYTLGAAAVSKARPSERVYTHALDALLRLSTSPFVETNTIVANTLTGMLRAFPWFKRPTRMAAFARLRAAADTARAYVAMVPPAAAASPALSASVPPAEDAIARLSLAASAVAGSGSIAASMLKELAARSGIDIPSSPAVSAATAGTPPPQRTKSASPLEYNIILSDARIACTGSLAGDWQVLSSLVDMIADLPVLMRGLPSDRHTLAQSSLASSIGWALYKWVGMQLNTQDRFSGRDARTRSSVAQRIIDVLYPHNGTADTPSVHVLHADGVRHPSAAPLQHAALHWRYELLLGVISGMLACPSLGHRMHVLADVLDRPVLREYDSCIVPFDLTEKMWLWALSAIVSDISPLRGWGSQMLQRMLSTLESTGSHNTSASLPAVHATLASPVYISQLFMAMSLQHTATHTEHGGGGGGRRGFAMEDIGAYLGQVFNTVSSSLVGDHACSFVESNAQFIKRLLHLCPASLPHMLSAARELISDLKPASDAARSPHDFATLRQRAATVAEFFAGTERWRLTQVMSALPTDIATATEGARSCGLRLLSDVNAEWSLDVQTALRHVYNRTPAYATEELTQAIVARVRGVLTADVAVLKAGGDAPLSVDTAPSYSEQEKLLGCLDAMLCELQLTHTAPDDASSFVPGFNVLSEQTWLAEPWAAAAASVDGSADPDNGVCNILDATVASVLAACASPLKQVRDVCASALSMLLDAEIPSVHPLPAHSLRREGMRAHIIRELVTLGSPIREQLRVDVSTVADGAAVAHTYTARELAVQNLMDTIITLVHAAAQHVDDVSSAMYVLILSPLLLWTQAHPKVELAALARHALSRVAQQVQLSAMLSSQTHHIALRLLTLRDCTPPALLHVCNDIAARPKRDGCDDRLLRGFVAMLCERAQLTFAGAGVDTAAALDVTDAAAWQMRRAVVQSMTPLAARALTTAAPVLRSDVLALCDAARVDKSAEVQQAASSALVGLLMCMGDAQQAAYAATCEAALHSVKLPKRVPAPASFSTAPAEEVERYHKFKERQAKAVKHRYACVLGLAAVIRAHPFDIPAFLPHVLTCVGKLVNDPQPIAAAVRSAFTTFTETHKDNWETHRQAFTPEELSELVELLVSPHYYA